MQTNSTWLKQAFRYIEKYAPTTYDAMMAAHWPVHLIETSDDLYPITRYLSYHEAQAFAKRLSHGLGMTVTALNGQTYDGPPELQYNTWMNKWKLEEQAARHGQDPLKLAADVLVHEWMHRRGYGEKEAYAAGTKFGYQMGEPSIAEVSAMTWRQLQQQEMSGLAELLELLGLAA